MEKEKWRLQEVARWVSGWCRSEGPDRWEGEGPPVNHASRQKEGRAQRGPQTRRRGHVSLVTSVTHSHPGLVSCGEAELEMKGGERGRILA